jgi:hypothetical protein
MGIHQERISRRVSFILKNGLEVFPVMMKRRDTGKLAFRISRGGTGGNTLSCGEEVDEETMLRKVLELGFSVRCVPLTGGRSSLYKPTGRSVREVRRHTGT